MEQIKALREKIGAGIVDCKKALDEAGGDLDKAVEILRKKGIAKAGKRTDREASEGLVLVAVNADHTEGYILEVIPKLILSRAMTNFKIFPRSL